MTAFIFPADYKIHFCFVPFQDEKNSNTGFIFLTMTLQRSRAQSSAQLQAGDSLYAKKNWAGAKMKYDIYLKTVDSNSMVWNRLGFCNQNLGFLQDALNDYNKSLNRNPSPVVKSVATLRTAQVYSLKNETENASAWLIRATALG
jgi:tetratricopeptide (TPR) repeat protein